MLYKRGGWGGDRQEERDSGILPSWAAFIGRIDRRVSPMEKNLAQLVIEEINVKHLTGGPEAKARLIGAGSSTEPEARSV